MQKIIDNRIEMIRGDSGFIPIKIMNGDATYLLADNDKLTLTIKTNTRTKEFLIQKNLTNADYKGNDIYTFVISPADTKDMNYGDYKYDIQLSINNDELVYTVVPPNSFKLLEEVTF